MHKLRELFPRPLPKESSRDSGIQMAKSDSSKLNTESIQVLAELSILYNEHIL